MPSVTESRPYIVAAEREASFSDLAAILFRRRMIILATMALVTIPSILYGLLRDPSYTAVSQLIVERNQAPSATGQSETSSQSESSAALQTEVNLLSSHPLVIRTMESLRLFDDPEFQTSNNIIARARELLRALIGRRNAPDAGTESDGSLGDTGDADEVLPPMDVARRIALEKFDKQLRVQNIENSSVIEVTFVSTSAYRAAAVTNRLARFYLQDRLDRKIRSTEKTAAWTAARLQDQQKLVLASENKVARLLSEHQFVLDRGAVLTATNMEEFNQELNRANAEIVKIESKLATIEKLKQAAGGADPTIELVDSPVLTQLRIQQADLNRQLAESIVVYGKRSSRARALLDQVSSVSERLAAEAARIVGAMRTDLLSLAEQVKTLEQRLKVEKDKNTAENYAAVHLQEAQRDAAAKRATYEDLLRRQQQARSLLTALEPGTRIISAAQSPTQPSSIGPGSVAAVGLVLSGLLGCALALIRDQSDKKLRSHRQIEEVLQVPCIALVPKLPENLDGPAEQDYLVRHPRSEYAQSIRNICSHLDLHGAKGKTVLVTSALPDEGKTRLAADIAICAAQQGRRTILIDFDVYRPMALHQFDLTPSPDEDEAAVSTSTMAANGNHAMVLNQSTGVDIMTVGGNRTETVPSVGPQQIDKLVKPLRKRYDLIVIDSPPLLGMNDARILAKYADAALFAVRWGVTDKDAAAAGMKIMNGASANVVGAVFTHVDTKKFAAMGYGPDYHRLFKEYYGE